MKAIIGEKIGMSQLWSESGRFLAVSLIHARPNKKTSLNNHPAIIAPKDTKSKKPQKYLAKLSQSRGVVVKNIVGLTHEKDVIKVSDFNIGEKVSVTAKTKGKGFAGTIKRHGFSRGPMSHGSDHHRAPGSIGAQRPQRVLKGTRMAGHMGSENLTVRGLTVAAIDADNDLLVLTGAIPGPVKGTVLIKSIAKLNE